ncbi:winged helix-turn-helix transcriptional regulator [Candidatus Saccharibacteria bacterium]|jgi:Predicted transcriptional regulators|nr:winged helix-turn-helix transcriptional regulator [Candidatus Saccharibacteria bacterium]
MLSPSEHSRLKQYIHGIDVNRLSAVFDALSEPNRCLIFRALLKTRHANVTQLAEAVGISSSLASQHLKTLRDNNMVVRRKQGKAVYYDVNDADPLVDALSKVVEN